MISYLILFLAFATTIGNRLYGKYALNKVDGFSLALSTNILGALITLPFAWPYLDEIKHVTPSVGLLILIAGLLWTYISWAGNLSVAQNNYSFKEIIRQTRVVWVVLAGIFLLGEEVTNLDIFGIILIAGSVLIVSYNQFSWREHVSSKAIKLAWSVSFVAAAIAVIEKMIVDSISVTPYMLCAYILPTLFLSLFLNSKRKVDLGNFFTFHKREAIACSVLMFLSYYLMLKALQLFPLTVAYPIIQASTVVGMLIGTYYFEENADLLRKLMAAIVAISGVILIKLF